MPSGIGRPCLLVAPAVKYALGNGAGAGGEGVVSRSVYCLQLQARHVLLFWPFVAGWGVLWFVKGPGPGQAQQAPDLDSGRFERAAVGAQQRQEQ